jgi:hypothetical protein
VQYASVLANLCHSKGLAHSIYGTTIIALMRHNREYGHLMHDVVSKLIWYDINILPLSFVDTIILDDPPSPQLTTFLSQLGFIGRILSMSNIRYLHAIGHVTVFQVLGGYALLPLMRSWLNKRFGTPYKISPIMFFDRGDNDRRAPLNLSSVRDLMTSMGIAINPPATNGTEYLPQLMSAAGTELSVTFHGAQAVNSLLTRKAFLEVMPFPYSLSEWAQSSLKMTNLLGISRYEANAIQVGPIGQNLPEFTRLSTDIAHLHDGPKCSQKRSFNELSLQQSNFWQKQPMYVHLPTLASKIEQLMSLLT